PCALGNMAPTQTKAVSLTYTVQTSGPNPVTNTATVSSTTTDPNSGNNSASASVTIGTCPATPTNPQPADGATDQQTTGILIWSDANAQSYDVYLGPKGGGCNTLVASNVRAPAYLYSGLQGGVTYEWRVDAVTPGCTTRPSACFTFTTVSTCPNTPPT